MENTGPAIVHFPTKHGDFPQLCNKLPEGTQREGTSITEIMAFPKGPAPARVMACAASMGITQSWRERGSIEMTCFGGLFLLCTWICKCNSYDSYYQSISVLLSRQWRCATFLAWIARNGFPKHSKSTGLMGTQICLVRFLRCDSG